MRAAATILILFLTLHFSWANPIDSLKTKNEVQNFLIENINPKWTPQGFWDNTETEDTTEGFLKVDLDNNGRTDLVINGKSLFAITDEGNGTYKSHFISGNAFMGDGYTLKNIVYHDKTPLLIIRVQGRSHFGGNITETDTLVLKFGEFYEYNSMPDNFSVEEINFSTSPCFGTCPVFELNIKADGTAKYNAMAYNDLKGKYTTVLDSVTLSQLFQTINYLKLMSLKEKYQVDWTDAQTATLEVKYKNGRTKTISDYGMAGTRGLGQLYKQLSALRETQKWEK